MFKNAIVRMVASLLLTVLVVGEAGAEGAFAPLNPAFLQWRKNKRYQQQPKTYPETKRVLKNALKSTATQVQDSKSLSMEIEGVIPTTVDFGYLKNINRQVDCGVGDALLIKYDPRPNGVTEIRQQDPNNQGVGTCWAQATIGSIETWLAAKTGDYCKFSVRNVVNGCGYMTGRSLDQWESTPWKGLNHQGSSAYLLKWGGPVLESEDPYCDNAGRVRLSYDSPTLVPQYHIQQSRIIPARTSVYDNEGLKRAIMEFGGFYATMCLYKPMLSDYGLPWYSKVKGAYYVKYNTFPAPTGHAVTLVGWDDNYSKDNFNPSMKPAGDGAFIVKDSYGNDNYRDDGYIYVSYYDASFMAAAGCAFPSPEPVDNYSRIYQYDPYGWTGTWSPTVGSTIGCGANMFIAEDDENISAVGFYATDQNESFKIRVYVGCDAENPESGKKMAEQSDATDGYAGYYTIPLNTLVPVTKGQRFSIVVDLNIKKSESKLFALEHSIEEYTDDATASTGQSFFKYGNMWLDMTEYAHPTANFCCKAYTKSATAPKKVLTGLEISPFSSMKVGDKKTLTCKAMYSDGSKSPGNVKPEKWWIVEGSAYASIGASSGEVVANAASGTKLVKVGAKYTEDGVSVEYVADWGFYVTAVAPNAPIDLEATQGDDASCVRLTWTAPEGATEFKVYRGATADSKNAKFMDTVTMGSKNMKYSDTSEDVVPGVDYYYFVKAKNNSGTSGFSAGAKGYKKLSSPEVRASDGSRFDGVELQWGEVAGAKYYCVYRADDPEEGAEKKSISSGWIPQTEYLDDTAEPGVTYYYYVVAAVDSRGNRPSDYSIIEDGYRGVPVTLDSLSIDGEPSIPSGGYATYTCKAAYTDKSTKNVKPTWSIIDGGEYASVDSSGKVTAKIVTANQTVTLQASWTDGVTRKDTKAIAITAVKPSAPSSVTLKSVTTEAVTISWSPVVGAAGYSVWRGTSAADAVQIVDVGNVTAYSDKKVTPGTSVTYWVKAYNTAGDSGLSSTSVATMRPLAAPMAVMASDGDYSDKVFVMVSPVAGATHYRLARATSATGAKTELGTWQTDDNFVDKSGVAGTHYWYFVKAATSSSGANASAYSAGDEGWRKVTVTLSSIAIIGGGTKVASGGKMTLSCLATYSDNTEKSVTPTWNVSPTAYATIDAAGQFSAKSVTADQKVTVTASFGGKTDAREIKIIAPVVATAKVSNVKATPRWPFSNLLDVDYELQTTPEGTRAAIALSGYDNDRRVAMAAHTLSGDGADGSVAAGKRRLTWDVAADYSDFRSSSLDVELTAVAITVTAPTDLTASSGTSSGGVNLSWTGVEDVTEYEIWRGTSSVSSAAAKIRSVEATSYLDSTAVAGTTYYYWVKAVSQDGVSDFSKAVTGSRPYANVVIKFNGNGGTASTSQQTLTPGTAYGTLPTGTRTGHTFDGWYTAASGGTKIIATSIVPTSATELFAHWKANTYTVTLNKNGGTCADLTSYTYGLGATLPTPTRASYTFGGWFTTSACTGTAVTKISPTDTGNKVFYAKWTPNTYMVTLNKNGGTCADLTSYTYGVGATLPTPTKAGNTFGGWFTTSACTGTAVTKISTTDTGNKVFYAKWTGISYTIAFNANGGSGTMSNISMVYGTAKNLTANAFTKTGHTFAGWATSSTGSVVYGNGVSVNNLTATSGATVTLYAKWTGISYTIAFNANGGSGTMSNLSMVYGTAKNLTANAFAKTGYTFAGWATSSTGSVVYGNGVSVNNLTATSGATVTLYAKWTVNTYTVTLNKNGGTCADLTSYTYGVGATLPTATKAGNTFGGWFTTSACTGTAVTKISTTDTGNKAFYAKWTGISYTIAFNANGGSGTMSNLSMVYGTAKNLTANSFTKTGYTFTGWATSSTGAVVYGNGVSVNNLTATSGATVTLYAQWTANTYMVTLDMQGGSGGTSSVTATYGFALPTIDVPRRVEYPDLLTTRKYKFNGYYDANGVQYYASDGTSTRTWDKTAVTTLYADWTEIVIPVPDVPTGVNATTNCSDGVLVTWNAANKAESYEILRTSTTFTRFISYSPTLRIESYPVDFKVIGTSTDTFYLDADTIVGTNYYYEVRSVNGPKSSDVSAYCKGRRMTGSGSIDYLKLMYETLRRNVNP